MKTCLICGVKADVSAPSCSSCGEGSWSATDDEKQLAAALLNRDEPEGDTAPPSEPEAPAAEPPHVEPPAGTPLTEAELAAATVPRDPSAASPDTIDETIAPSDETETPEPETNESSAEETPSEPEAPKKASSKKARK